MKINKELKERIREDLNKYIKQNKDLGEDYFYRFSIHDVFAFAIETLKKYGPPED